MIGMGFALNQLAVLARKVARRVAAGTYIKTRAGDNVTTRSGDRIITR